MEINEHFKNVLFYGRILQVKRHASYIAANADGEIFAFLGEPYCLDARKIYRFLWRTRGFGKVRSVAVQGQWLVSSRMKAGRIP